MYGTRSVPSGQVLTTDYFLDHTSTEPSYALCGADPRVVLHVREVVRSDRRRTAGKDGTVLLLLHGGSTYGTPAFDLDHSGCSMMRSLAEGGWDTFALDFEGYGLSSRPPSMDVGVLIPDARAPVSTSIALDDVERVVTFIRELRGAETVCLLGWSLEDHANVLSSRSADRSG